MSPENSNGNKPGRSFKVRKRSRRKQKPSHTLHHIYNWIRFNPLTATSVFAIGVIIYFSILFYRYSKDIKRNSEKVLNSKVQVKGLKFTDTILVNNNTLKIRFGSTEQNFTLEKLRRGISLSPASLITCENITSRKDPTVFYIYLEDNQLFAVNTLKNLSTEEMLGTLNKKYLNLLSGTIRSFRSGNSFFEIIDEEENVVFSMQLKYPNILQIQGYFITKNCVYVASDNVINAYNKNGNYLQAAQAEIKKIHKLSNYNID